MSSQAAEQADQASLLIKELSSLQPSLTKTTGDSTRQEMIRKATESEILDQYLGNTHGVNLMDGLG